MIGELIKPEISNANGVIFIPTRANCVWYLCMCKFTGRTDKEKMIRSLIATGLDKPAANLILRCGNDRILSTFSKE